MNRRERFNHSSINDIGYRIEFDYRPGVNHHIRFGNNYLYHIYHPQNIASRNLTEKYSDIDTLSLESASR